MSDTSEFAKAMAGAFGASPAVAPEETPPGPVVEETAGELHEEPPEVQEPDGGGEEVVPETPAEKPKSRAEQRIQELLDAKAKAEAKLEQAENTAKWLASPQGQAWVASQQGGSGQPQQPAGWDWSQKTDAQVAEELLAASRSQAARIVQGELQAGNVLSDLAKSYKDFDPNKDGRKVRQFMDAGLEPEAAYFAAYPERVKERAAHIQRGAVSKRTVAPGGSRPSQPRDEAKEAAARRADLEARARAGDRSVLPALMAEAFGASRPARTRQ